MLKAFESNSKENRAKTLPSSKTEFSLTFLPLFPNFPSLFLYDSQSLQFHLMVNANNGRFYLNL